MDYFGFLEEISRTVPICAEVNGDLGLQKVKLCSSGRFHTQIKVFASGVY